MANSQDLLFFRSLTDRISRLAIARARPQIPSRTLRRALVSIRVTDTQVKMNITHYWAVFVHEGRGEARARSGQFLAWYRNPREDPRLTPFGGQTPPRASQLLGLRQVISAQQFREDVNAGKVVFAERTGPVAGVPFFSNDAGGGMHGFVDQANRLATPLTRKHILERIGKENLRERDVAVLTLGF